MRESRPRNVQVNAIKPKMCDDLEAKHGIKTLTLTYNIHIYFLK